MGSMVCLLKIEKLKVKYMQKKAILILGTLILFVFITSISAKVQMIDMVHLTDGNIIGRIIKAIPKKE